VQRCCWQAAGNYRLAACAPQTRRARVTDHFSPFTRLRRSKFGNYGPTVAAAEWGDPSASVQIWVWAWA
jgi:hypothetical protein